MDSKIGLKFTKSYHTSSNAELLVEYKISEIMNQASITRGGIAFPIRSPISWLSSKKSTSIAQSKPLVMKVKFPNDEEVS